MISRDFADLNQGWPLVAFRVPGPEKSQNETQNPVRNPDVQNFKPGTQPV